MRTLAALAALVMTVAASADPPCNIRHHAPVVVPQRVLHSQAIHSATIYHDTHLHLVEVPVPAYVFQTLTAYQPPPIAPVQAPAPQRQSIIQQADAGVGTDDNLRELLGLASPVMADPTLEIRQKCAKCHSEELGTTKGGLALFDAKGGFAPASTKQTNRSLIAARAKATGPEAMPPGADTNPEKRLSELAIRYLETGQ